MPRLRLPRQSAAPRNAGAASEPIDTSFLESLLGYNARRAALSAIEVFMRGMAPYRLRPVELSVLSVVGHNPGVTSRQLCASLGILPPNLVGMLNALEKRGLIARVPHPTDGRAMALHLTEEGSGLLQDAERTVSELEATVGARLTPGELRTLIRLLKKVYQDR